MLPVLTFSAPYLALFELRRSCGNHCGEQCKYNGGPLHGARAWECLSFCVTMVRSLNRLNLLGEVLLEAASMSCGGVL